ncbi:MAG: AMP-binding protein [Coriobacteriaceae bacterium]
MATVVGNENLRDLWNELSASRGDHLFLTCEDRAGHRRSFTYGEFDRLVNRTANFLRLAGVKKGDNVAIQLYNSPEYVGHLHLGEDGAVAVPIAMQLVAASAPSDDRCAIRTVICEPARATISPTPCPVPEQHLWERGASILWSACSSATAVGRGSSPVPTSTPG